MAWIICLGYVVEYTETGKLADLHHFIQIFGHLKNLIKSASYEPLLSKVVNFDRVLCSGRLTNKFRLGEL